MTKTKHPPESPVATFARVASRSDNPLQTAARVMLRIQEEIMDVLFVARITDTHIHWKPPSSNHTIVMEVTFKPPGRWRSIGVTVEVDGRTTQTVTVDGESVETHLAANEVAARIAESLT